MMPPFGSILEPPTHLPGGQSSSFYVKKEPVEATTTTSTTRMMMPKGMESSSTQGPPRSSQQQQSAFSNYYDTHPQPHLRKHPLQHESSSSAFGPFSSTQSYGGTAATTKAFMMIPPQPTSSPPSAFNHHKSLRGGSSAMLSRSSEVGLSGLVTGVRDTLSDGYVAGSSKQGKGSNCKQECDIASSSVSAPPLTRKRSYSVLAEESCDSELVLGIGGRGSREGSEYNRNSRASSPSKLRRQENARLGLVSADLCLAPPVVTPEYSSSSSHEDMSQSLPETTTQNHHHQPRTLKLSNNNNSHGVNNVSPTESHLSFQKIKSEAASKVEEATYPSSTRALLNLEVIKRECDAVQRDRYNEESYTQSQNHGGGIELGLFPGASSSPHHNPEGEKSEASGLQLVHLLLRCADAVSKNKIETAAKKIEELNSHASLFGDSMQRIATYFTEGLAARIVGKENPIYKKVMVQSRLDDYLSAFTTLYRVCPYFQFGHFTANQAIAESFEGHPVVHVIDLDLMQGFQWPGLIQSLSEREGGPPKLKITGIGTSCTSLQDTGRRLAAFAETFQVPFEFHAVVGELEDLTPMELGARPGETIAVNCVMQLHRLLNHPTGEKLQKFISGLRSLSPVMLTLVEQEANHNTTTFLSRFLEALHYYAAVFDSLDSSLPMASEERVKIEQLYFAQQIKNIVACEGVDRIERHETLEAWQHRFELAGFRQLPLSSHSVTQAKLLLSLSPCDGYRLAQQPCGSISLGWQDRNLLTASTWVL